MRILIPGFVLVATALSQIPRAAPTVVVSGGIQPLLFTWNTSLSIGGGGWKPGESVRVVLHGPLDSPEIRPRRLPRVSPRVRVGRDTLGAPSSTFPDLVLGTVTADAQGNLAASLKIPYDNGIVGPQTRIPRPGYYQVLAFGNSSGLATGAAPVNLAPEANKSAIDWGHERGGRTGVFPDPISQFSPERMDPEWPTTWDERPVEIYGSVAVSRVSHTDNPPTHYAHDLTIYVDPDPSYRWLLGTANYNNADSDADGIGRLELEWETQNGGNTSSYGQGNIGVPIWAAPSAGDRVYAVGRWILDAGHPDPGARTEMHPPRLLATLRARPATSFGAAASQVDLCVSGHGGGANTMPPGLSEILDEGGYGGGRIRDALQPSEQDKYYRAGPLSTFLFPLVSELIKQLAGVSIGGTIYADAGPSGFPWGAPGPELRPVNDHDYDFDVPLPPAPSAAASPRVEVITHAEHSTAVSEYITYNGATAHIHLPYRGADNGIYARTLKFSWDAAAPPAVHRVVRLQRIDVVDSAGKWQMWADVSGQWSYLTGAAPQMLNTASGQSVALPGAPVDVYLNTGQTLRVSVHGYRATCIDDFFGKLYNQSSSYTAGLSFVAQCGPNDNQDLGAATVELPADSAPGPHTIAAADALGARHFSVTFTVE